jgi:hypothetical protein
MIHTTTHRASRGKIKDGNMSIERDGNRYAPGREPSHSMDGYRDMVTKLEARQGARPDLSESGAPRFRHLRDRATANIEGDPAAEPRAAAKPTSAAVAKAAPQVSAADLDRARQIIAAGEMRRARERQAAIDAGWKKAVAAANARHATRP